MICTRRQLSPEEETLLHLLGPTHGFSEKDMLIYSQAGLCKVRELDRGLQLQLGSRVEPTEQQLFTSCTTFPKPWMRQTYRQWKASMDMGFLLGQIKKHKVIYIQPLGSYPDLIGEFSLAGQLGLCGFLRCFCEVFFEGFQVRLLSAVDPEKAGWKITTRTHTKTQQKQLLVTDLQQCLRKCMPKDGYCIVGVSWMDLYPKDGVDFMLGDAHAGLRSAAMCFGRFRPQTFKEGQPCPPDIERVDGSIVWRMMKVITHETCHLLGLAHCVYFSCAMNESTSLEQAMEQPLFLCPVCLRKLHKVSRLDLRQRYEHMLRFLQEVVRSHPDVRTVHSVEWLTRALAVLSGDGPR